jgi:hypothetical protein
MRIMLAAALALGACKAAKPPAPVQAVPAPVPAAEAPMEQNRAEKYVSGLQADVKRAQDVKDKADAANKKSEEAQKVPE